MLIRKVSPKKKKKKKKKNSLKLGPKQKQKLVLGLLGKTQNLKNILISNLFLYTTSHMWPQKWGAVRLWFWLNSKSHRTTYVTAKMRCGTVMVLAKPHCMVLKMPKTAPHCEHSYDNASCVRKETSKYIFFRWILIAFPNYKF